MHVLNLIMKKVKKNKKKRQRIKRRLDKELRKLDREIRKYKKILEYHKKTENYGEKKTEINRHNITIDIEERRKVDEMDETINFELTQMSETRNIDNEYIGVEHCHKYTSTPIVPRTIEKQRANGKKDKTENKDISVCEDKEESNFKLVEITYGDSVLSEDDTKRSAKRIKLERQNNQEDSIIYMNKNRRGGGRIANRRENNNSNTNAKISFNKEKTNLYGKHKHAANNVHKSKEKNELQNKKNDANKNTIHIENKETRNNESEKKSKQKKRESDSSTNENDESESEGNSTQENLFSKVDVNDKELINFKKVFSEITSEKPEKKLIDKYIKNSKKNDFNFPTKLLNSVTLHTDKLISKETIISSESSESSEKSDNELKSDDEIIVIPKQKENTNSKKRLRYTPATINKLTWEDAKNILHRKDDELVKIISAISYHDKKKMEKLDSLSKLKTDIEDIVKHQEQISKTTTEKEFIAAFGVRMAEQFKVQEKVNHKKNTGVERDENAPKISQLKSSDRKSKSQAEDKNDKSSETNKPSVMHNTQMIAATPTETVNNTKKNYNIKDLLETNKQVEQFSNSEKHCAISQINQISHKGEQAKSKAPNGNSVQTIIDSVLQVGNGTRPQNENMTRQQSENGTRPQSAFPTLQTHANLTPETINFHLAMIAMMTNRNAIPNTFGVPMGNYMSNLNNSYNSFNNINVQVPSHESSLDLSKPETPRVIENPMEMEGIHDKDTNKIASNNSSLLNLHETTNLINNGNMSSSMTQNTKLPYSGILTSDMNIPKPLITGGNEAQDNNEIRFRISLNFVKDLSQKWVSRTVIYKMITDNYRTFGKKFAGPVEVYLKDSRTIIIIGERESDLITFESRKWTNKAFDGTDFKMNIEMIMPDKEEIMLIGTTRTLISPNGIDELKKNYNISRIVSKGTNKYELKFRDEKSRNLAKELGILATAGLKIRLSEWHKIFETSQCNKCLKYGHFRNECKTRMTIGNCKYCGESDSNHESAECPELHFDNNHKCINCKQKKGYATHNAGERYECEFFLEFYMSACERLKITPENKYVVAMEKVKVRDSKVSNGIASNKEFMTKMNRKFANQQLLNKKLFGADQNYTAMCEEYLDESVMREYNTMKDY
jgi:hypothetical protein